MAPVPTVAAVQGYLGKIIDAEEPVLRPEQVSALFGNIEDIYELSRWVLPVLLGVHSRCHPVPRLLSPRPLCPPQQSAAKPGELCQRPRGRGRLLRHPGKGRHGKGTLGRHRVTLRGHRDRAGL